MKGVRIHRFGGPEVMRFEEAALPQPAAGQALVRVEAGGVNFIDVYQRSGAYNTSLPYWMGLEGAGVVEAVGPAPAGAAVAGTVASPAARPGDRVAWSSVAGSYATHVLAPVEKLVPVPRGLDAEQAAASMLQGMTAHYLTHGSYPVKAGDTILVHAAAGGVGRLVTQMAKRLGARVIGTVSTEEKAAVAREAGADEVILYTWTDLAAEVRRLTDGAGVQVVYDGVGRATFDAGLDCLAPLGYMILFGQASGPVTPVDPRTLNQKGGLYLQRPMLGLYTATREALLARAGEVLGWVAGGGLQLLVGGTYPLAEAAQAHRDLEGRRTVGKLLLVP